MANHASTSKKLQSICSRRETFDKAHCSISKYTKDIFLVSSVGSGNRSAVVPMLQHFPLLEKLWITLHEVKIHTVQLLFIFPFFHFVSFAVFFFLAFLFNFPSFWISLPYPLLALLSGTGILSYLSIPSAQLGKNDHKEVILKVMNRGFWTIILNRIIKTV